MHTLKNIIFDLGHVILNIDHQLMIQSFSRLGALEAEKSFLRVQKEGLIDLYAKGKISSVEFEDQFQKLLNIQVSHQEFCDAFNKMLLDIPLHRFETLKLLQKKYRIFLLSNTNPLHLEHIMKYLHTLIGHGFEAYFEGEYYSHLIGLLKPDPAAYEHVLAAHQLKPQETMLVDDTLENIQSAEELGLETLHISEKMTFEKAGDYLLKC